MGAPNPVGGFGTGKAEGTDLADSQRVDDAIQWMYILFPDLRTGRVDIIYFVRILYMLCVSWHHGYSLDIIFFQLSYYHSLGPEGRSIFFWGDGPLGVHHRVSEWGFCNVTVGRCVLVCENFNEVINHWSTYLIRISVYIFCNVITDGCVLIGENSMK